MHGDRACTLVRKAGKANVQFFGYIGSFQVPFFTRIVSFIPMTVMISGSFREGGKEEDARYGMKEIPRGTVGRVTWWFRLGRGAGDAGGEV
jgi:hypothetical protein